MRCGVGVRIETRAIELRDASAPDESRDLSGVFVLWLEKGWRGQWYRAQPGRRKAACSAVSDGLQLGFSEGLKGRGRVRVGVLLGKSCLVGHLHIDGLVPRQKRNVQNHGWTWDKLTEPLFL